MSDFEIPTPELAASTLVCLPEMTPARLRWLFEHFGGPLTALRAVQEGRAGAALRTTGPGWLSDAARAALARTWRDCVDLARTARQLDRRGTDVWIVGTPSYPIAEDVPDRPAVLLAEGQRPDVLGATAGLGGRHPRRDTARSRRCARARGIPRRCRSDGRERSGDRDRLGRARGCARCRRRRGGRGRQPGSTSSTHGGTRRCTNACASAVSWSVRARSALGRLGPRFPVRNRIIARWPMSSSWSRQRSAAARASPRSSRSTTGGPCSRCRDRDATPPRPGRSAHRRRRTSAGRLERRPDRARSVTRLAPGSR